MKARDLNIYQGIFPAFYACYDDVGEGSPARARACTEYLIEKGVHGLYVGGASGECIYHSVAERKALLEAVIAHNESPISSWLLREYGLNLTYADENVAFSPYLTALRAAIRRETEAKIEKGE